MNHDVRIQTIPYIYSLRLAIFYLPEIRSSVPSYLVQSRSQQVLYSFRNPISLCDSLLNHMLASGVDINYRVGPKYISPTWEGQIPSRYIQPNRYFPITRETPL